MLGSTDVDFLETFLEDGWSNVLGFFQEYFWEDKQNNTWIFKKYFWGTNEPIYVDYLSIYIKGQRDQKTFILKLGEGETFLKGLRWNF